MTAQFLNTIGLILNIIGVVLVFFFGLPQPSHKEGIGLGLEDATPLGNGLTVAQHNAVVRRRRILYTRFAYLALSLILIGFMCQLAATIWL